MKFPRCSGILLHPTSLPGRYGIGDLGPEAFRFADFLNASGQTLWQMLPLGPTGYGDSPYQLFSAFAGNPLLISLDQLVEEGLLGTLDIPAFPEGYVAFGEVIEWKHRMLRRAYQNFRTSGSAGLKQAFDAFCVAEAPWLEPFARFMALKEANGVSLVWPQWSKLTADALEEQIDCLKFYQFEFFRQWSALRAYCRTKNIRLMGDVPIYVAHDSADVWAAPEWFHLDDRGWPSFVAGVPPDYFSATGQLWGNPIYRWQEMERDGFAWWIERFRAAFRMLDILRLDHFRGFEAYWQVPAGEPTAVNGRWMKGPGSKLFRALRDAFGDLPIVAENLGVITPEVEALRDEFGFPGMAILQFAFGTDPQAPNFLPHNFPRNVVAYTGTHDNDTTAGWWRSTGESDSTRTAEEVRAEKAHAMAYLRSDGQQIHWDFIATLLASVANTVIVPMQDVMGCGSEARMNIPSVPGGNWRWRFRWRDVTTGMSDRLYRLAKLYDRI